MVPLLNAVGPPATEEIKIMRAEPAAFNMGYAAYSHTTLVKLLHSYKLIITRRMSAAIQMSRRLHVVQV